MFFLELLSQISYVYQWKITFRVKLKVSDLHIVVRSIRGAVVSQWTFAKAL